MSIKEDIEKRAEKFATRNVGGNYMMSCTGETSAGTAWWGIYGKYCEASEEQLRSDTKRVWGYIVDLMRGFGCDDEDILDESEKFSEYMELK